MTVHIDDLQTTVEVQPDQVPSPAPESRPDEMTERARLERYQCDRDRLHAEGYGD
jgi:hypothetical protein